MKYYIAAHQSIKLKLRKLGYRVVTNSRANTIYSNCTWLGYDTEMKTVFSVDCDRYVADSCVRIEGYEAFYMSLNLTPRVIEVSPTFHAVMTPAAVPSALLSLPDSITSVVCNGITYTRQMTWVASAK